MFGLGPLEILVILAAFVIFVGPDKIPEVTKQLARFFVQAKRMSSDVKNVVDDAIRDAEREIEVKDIKHLISDLEPSSTDECEDEHDDINSDVDSNDKTGSDLNEDLEHTSQEDDIEEVLNDDGIPNSSVNMNSSLDRGDPFADDDTEETQKSE